MTVANKNPTRNVGGILFSGGPNTGEVLNVRGGVVAFTLFSGGLTGTSKGIFPPGAVVTADQVLIVSGAGRLNSILPFGVINTLSGIPTWFYNSATAAASGGGAGAAGGSSGAVTLGVLNIAFGGSGLVSSPLIQNLDIPFTSGLCVSNLSGCGGFTATYTPEVIPPPGV